MPDVRTAVIQIAAETSTGTQDITSSGFGTPKAALVFASYPTTTGMVDHAALSMGITDGMTAVTGHGRAQHNVGTSDSRRRGRSSALVQLFESTSTSIEAEAEFDSFITDGIRIDWTNAPGDPILLTVVLFGGEDVQAHVDDVLVTSNSGQSITSPGFDPRMVFGIGIGTSFGDSSGTDWPPQYGVAVRGPADSVVQGSVNATWDHSHSNNLIGQYTSDDLIVSNLNPGLNDPNRSIRVSDWVTNGFQVQKVQGSLNFDLWFAYLALTFPSEVGVWTDIITAPNSTGLEGYTEPGFTPQIVGLAATQATVLNQTSTSGEPVGVLGIGFATATSEASVTVGGERSVSTANNYSTVDATALTLPQNDRSTGHVATLDSFDENGFTLLFSETLTATRPWVAWAIEAVDEEEPPPDDHSGSAGTDVTVNAEGQGTKHAAGAGNANVASIAEGTGTKQGSGSGTALVAVAAQGTGTAAEVVAGSGNAAVDVASAGSGAKHAAGSAGASVSVAADGSGAKAAAGNADTAVTVVAAGSGFPVVPDSAFGSAGTSVTVASDGSGTKATSGAADASVTVTAAGDGFATEPDAFTGAAGADVVVDPDGAGVKHASGAAGTQTTADAAGTGIKGAAGSGSAQIEIIAVGSGFRPADHFAGAGGTAVLIQPAGTGSKQGAGSGLATLAVIAAGTATTQRSGSANTAVLVTAAGFGFDIEHAFISTVHLQARLDRVVALSASQDHTIELNARQDRTVSLKGRIDGSD